MDNREHAAQMQMKFNFLMVTLAFGILGLAVQTFAPSKAPGAFWPEVCGWCLLLLSGLVGLWRLEKGPFVYILKGLIEKWEHTPSKTSERYEIIKELLAEATSKLDTTQAQMERRYWCHKWCFVAGVILLAISRFMVVVGNMPVEQSG